MKAQFGIRNWEFDAGCLIHDAGYRIWDMRYEMPDMGCEMQNLRFAYLDFILSSVLVIYIILFYRQVRFFDTLNKTI